ncbi:MAG: galactokinase [Candelina mexicana]|nr:MAG: galactokinase [Candelina mexicana]
MAVPTSTTLEDIYPDDALSTEKPRWQELLSRFQNLYGHRPGFVARSPGRVNIIGEHIDYSLYEVLPMAITADILLAVSVNSNAETECPTIRIANLNNSKYPSSQFELPSNGDVSIDASSHDWVNYFKAGLRGALEVLRVNRGEEEGFLPSSMDILVHGTVPSGGGLSSSAAFVCASALAVMKANSKDNVDKQDLVNLAVVSERAVGVNSGGMDQSASVFSLQGSAIYVSFKPTIYARLVEFPATKPEMTFLVAQSFVAADKHVTGPIHYNLRVMECSLAAQFLASKLGLKRSLPEDSSPLRVSLRGFQDTYFEEVDGIKDNTKTSISEFTKQLEALVQLAQEHLDQADGYSREDIASVIGISVQELNHRFTSRVPVRAERFFLRQRALHVFSEAIRVTRFMSLLSSSSDQGEQLLKNLGSILNETQTSCREMYDCSCPEIDELCKLALDAGAYGSRLTGAGWGGCSVHLVPQAKVGAIKKAWEMGYYRKQFPNITEEKLAEAVVVSKPGNGSSILEIKETTLV